MGGFAPTHGTDSNAALNRAGDFRSLDAAGPGVGDIGGLEMRIYAVILEPLQGPGTGGLHLRGTGQSRPNLGCEVLQVLYQFGVGLHLVIDLLVGFLHRLTVALLFFGRALLCPEWNRCQEDGQQNGWEGGYPPPPSNPWNQQVKDVFFAKSRGRGSYL